MARVEKSHQGRTQSDLSLLVEEEVQVFVAIVWVLLLPLPAQELPVELRTPEQSIAETASISCKSASLWHADAEDAASEARVQDGHSAHDARLMSEVDFKIDAEVAIRD